MKIIYLIAGTYRAAGMERVLASKANWLAARGYGILIVTTEQKGRRPAFPLDPSIRCIDLGIGYEDNNGGSFIDKLVNYPAKQRRHREALTRVLEDEQADIVISMFCNDASFVPSIPDGSRKILEIHFSRFKRLQYGRRGLWALTDRVRSINDRRVASRFDEFVVLTEEDRGYWGDMKNISVIPNARTFTPEAIDGVRTGGVEPAKIVLAAGRYGHQKHFEALMEAWALIPESVREGWALRIAGYGEDRLLLEAKSVELGIKFCTVFGPASDMMEEYARASVFALSSRYEGLPMVLLEAQAAGLPVVSFACKCGPRDVLTDGVDGYIVKEGDATAMAERLGRLMTDDVLRSSMGAAARRASERFEEESIMHRWEDLFNKR